MTSSLSLIFHDDDTLLSAVVEELVNESLSLTLIISTFSVGMVMADDVILIVYKASKKSECCIQG